MKTLFICFSMLATITLMSCENKKTNSEASEKTDSTMVDSLTIDSLITDSAVVDSVTLK